MGDDDIRALATDAFARFNEREEPRRVLRRL